MIRFLPDNWREMLLRPVAMAAPDAGVYIEIMAPDLRFLFALLLIGVLTLLLCLRRRAGYTLARPTLILLGAVVAGFVPWFATTANGRYFIPGLLAVGPLCIGLVFLLPLTRGFRLTIALLLVALQTFVVQQSSPWQAWGLAQWKEAPFFDVEVPREMMTVPATYVTISNISYSLLAPRFPAESRWISLANAPSAASGNPDSRRAQELLAAAPTGQLMLIAPAIPGYGNANDLPNAAVTAAMNDQLGAHRLELAESPSCRFLPSRGLASMAFRQGDVVDVERARRFGFWVCPLRYQAAARFPPVAQPGHYEAVFQKLEADCPRFFAPGQVGATAIAGGEMRVYSQAEMKVYVLDSGPVMYKYYRALNPVRIGAIEDVLSGKARVDCTNIRGRSGLPWERAI